MKNQIHTLLLDKYVKIGATAANLPPIMRSVAGQRGHIVGVWMDNDKQVRIAVNVERKIHEWYQSWINGEYMELE